MALGDADLAVVQRERDELGGLIIQSSLGRYYNALEHGLKS
jgi:hypothetical protein